MTQPGELQSGVVLTDIAAAKQRIHGLVPATPLTHSQPLSELAGLSVFCKWENKLRTGSFKERGTASVLTKLADAEKAHGVCAASAGNHALAVSSHAAALGVPCHIVMPVFAPLVKVQRTRATGAQVLLHGNSFNDAYEFALDYAGKNGLTFISAFDHPLVIAGQGTIGLELLEQLPDLDAVIVPVGGGGLIAGIATAIKALRPEVFILGVRSEWAVQSEQGQSITGPLALPPVSIADGIAVKHLGRLTKPILAEKVDKMVAVNEQEIASAIMLYLEKERCVVEGAGAAALAGLLNQHLPAHTKKVVVTVSGSNIDMNLLSRLIDRDMGEKERLLRLKVSVPDRPGSLHRLSGILAETGANVLEVQHNRSFSEMPGNVEITFLVEVRDRGHKVEILGELARRGGAPKEL